MLSAQVVVMSIRGNNHTTSRKM